MNKTVEQVLAEIFETDPQIDVIDGDPEHKEPIARVIAALERAGYLIIAEDEMPD